MLVPVYRYPAAAFARAKMAGFSGFTEDEIFRLKMQGQGLNPEERERKERIKKATISNTGKRGKPRGKVRSKPVNSVPSQVNEELATSATIIKSPNKKTELVEEQVVDEKTAVEKPREVEVIMETERVKELELSKLEKMQQKQKEMEMVNKKKAKMLQYTLKERYKKTKKETETLQLVQKELGHLDHLLYADVQILRDKIDDACREFEAARKRYEKAETEFINAKVNLHAKTETKDQLTEHLCSIIQENEERKAKKLAELMVKLEIDEQDLKESETMCQTETKTEEKEEKIDNKMQEESVSQTEITADLTPKPQPVNDKLLSDKDCEKTEVVPSLAKDQSNNNNVFTINKSEANG